MNLYYNSPELIAWSVLVKNTHVDLLGNDPANESEEVLHDLSDAEQHLKCTPANLKTLIIAVMITTNQTLNEAQLKFRTSKQTWKGQAAKVF